MWFDELMDDCKLALNTAVKNKGVFLPMFISGVINIVILILLFAAIIMFVIIIMAQGDSVLSHDIKNKIPIIITLVLSIYMIFTIIGVMLEVGSVNLYKMALGGFNLRATYFFDGIKKYFFKVFGFTLLCHLLGLILLIPVAALFLLYSFTIGIMTAGWGVTVLFIISGVYFGTWTIALIVDDSAPFKALGASFKFGGKNFLKLFILVLASSQISQYIFSAFGPLISIAVGWFISGAVVVYFRLVTMIMYRKKGFESEIACDIAV